VLAAHEAEHGRPTDLPALPPLSERRARDLSTRRVANDGSLADTAMSSLLLLREGITPEQVAERRGMSPRTIWGHLAKCIEAGAADVSEVVDLPDRDLKRIRNALQQLADGPSMPLKPAFEALEGEYPYEVLSCVRAAEMRAAEG
jgi:ATP-dependent DNA helicase RecQ